MRLWGSWEWVRKATKMSDSAAFENDVIPTAKKFQIKTEKTYINQRWFRITEFDRVINNQD
jgi:hypothetical protein